MSPSAGELEVASDGQLRFFDSRQKSWLHVGDIVERGPSTYTIRLTEACSAGAIQAISRRLTFEGNPSPEANGDYVKTLQFELRDGRNRSANAAPEVKSLRCTSAANTQSPSS